MNGKCKPNNKLRLSEKLNGSPVRPSLSGAAHWLLTNHGALCLMGCGMAPIGALCLAIFGLWSLRLATLAFVLPATVVVVIVARRAPAEGKIALMGFTMGVMAVFFYDAFRLFFVCQGWWGDFIPRIGGWLLGSHHPDAFLGYTWRWIGNGGGMGITCVLGYAVAFRGRRSTFFRSIAFCTGFGVVIWGCLILTLIVSARGQSMLFKITPLTLVLSLIGHLVYGACIGLCNTKLKPWVKEEPAVSSMRDGPVANTFVSEFRKEKHSPDRIPPPDSRPASIEVVTLESASKSLAALWKRCAGFFSRRPV